MTPFARELLLRGSMPKEYSDAFKQAICFDMSAVADLTHEIKHLYENDWNNWHSHGGLAIAPSEAFWFEIRNTTGKFGWICLCFDLENDEKGIVVRTFEEIVSCGHESVAATIILKNDDVRIVNHSGAAFPTTKSQNTVQYYSISSVIAFLLIINAPYGIANTSLQRHKGHVREARRNGFELLPHHIITIDKKAPPEGFGNGVGGSPKAFHFVRSHGRNYKTGKRSIVKAHWRGDPRLGIHQSSYAVKFKG